MHIRLVEIYGISGCIQWKSHAQQTCGHHVLNSPRMNSVCGLMESLQLSNLVCVLDQHLAESFDFETTVLNCVHTDEHVVFLVRLDTLFDTDLAASRAMLLEGVSYFQMEFY